MLMELMSTDLIVLGVEVPTFATTSAEGQGYLLMELMATDLGAALHNRPEKKDDRSYAWTKK